MLDDSPCISVLWHPENQGSFGWENESVLLGIVQLYSKNYIAEKKCMIIVASHKISNPAYFWGSTLQNLPNLPEGGVRRILNVFPNQNMDMCTCVWEADSIEVLDAYLKEKIGNASRNMFYEVNLANAVGVEL